MVDSGVLATTRWVDTWLGWFNTWPLTGLSCTKCSAALVCGDTGQVWLTAPIQTHYTGSPDSHFHYIVCTLHYTVYRVSYTTVCTSHYTVYRVSYTTVCTSHYTVYRVIYTIVCTSHYTVYRVSYTTVCTILGKLWWHIPHPGGSYSSCSQCSLVPVSYTHLTLPTKRIV